jgi:hypothetical protein
MMETRFNELVFIGLRRIAKATSNYIRNGSLFAGEFSGDIFSLARRGMAKRTGGIRLVFY